MIESQQAIVRSIKTRIFPEQIWDAWMDTENLSHWLVDQASGWPGVGSTLSLTWERLRCTIDYQVAEAKPCEKLVWRTKMPAGFQTLTITLRREGPITAVELREQAPEDAPSADESSSGSSWQIALAVLKLYLEKYAGCKRSSFFSIKAADFSDEQLLEYYLTPAGWMSWLASSVEKAPTLGQVGPFSLTTRWGTKMSGQVLTVTRNEALLSWDEIDGFLELKCFSLGPGQQAICLRGSTYTLGSSKSAGLEKELDTALGLLSAILRAPES